VKVSGIIMRLKIKICTYLYIQGDSRIVFDLVQSNTIILIHLIDTTVSFF
jgi:hypothetical protein